MESAARRAVLLDQHPLWLDAVERTLTSVGVMSIGNVSSPGAALALLAREQPELLVAEPEARDREMDGLACIREARERSPQLKIVAFSASAEAQRIEAAFAVGADAYVVKTARSEDISAAIRQAFEHSIYFAHSLSVPVQPVAAGGLTRREREILSLVAEGHTNAQLARMLWVTEQTVKFHLSNIYRKLDVANRTEASRWAQVHGVVGTAPATAGAAA